MTDTAPWLVTSRPEAHPVVAGVFFEAGLLHQPTEHLGVASLLCAWLNARLTEPVEADDPVARDPRARVTVAIGLTMTSVRAEGSVEAVGEALGGIDEILAGAGHAAVDDELRNRAQVYRGSMAPWASHFAARWPWHRPHLAVLGPLALGTLGNAALGDFATGSFGTARRVYWTNEPELTGLVRPPEPGPAPPPIAPAGWRGKPGCVVARDADELFTLAMRDTHAARIGLSVLVRALNRRLVHFESLATRTMFDVRDVGGDVILARGLARVLPGQDSAVRAGVMQTLEDLADGSLPGGEIATVRDTLAHEERSAAPYDDRHVPDGIVTLARQCLITGDRATHESNARNLELTTDDRVLAALGAFLPELILAIPDSDTANPPLPMAERTGVRPAEGDKFKDRTALRWARCSPDRLAIEAQVSRPLKRSRKVTQASVDFDAVVLRIDSGRQSTTLVDEQHFTVDLTWGLYRKQEKLRRLVEHHTAGIPVIDRKGDPARAEQLAMALRQSRRQVVFVSVVISVCLAVLAFAVIGAVVSSLTDNTYEPESEKDGVRTTVDAREKVTLPNKATLRVVAGPEYIAHLNPETAYAYGIRVRMCGGEDSKKTDPGPLGARNYFGAAQFKLVIAEESPQELLPPPPSRPKPRDDTVDRGECATGWLLYRLTTKPNAPAALKYSNSRGDRVTWRLPPNPADSPLSKPCPKPGAPSGFQVWAGCPGKS